MTRRRFPVRFRAKRWFIRKIFRRLIPEIPSNAHSPWEIFNIFLSSGSFIDFWIDAKSNPFSKTWISISESTLWLRLKTVLEQNEPWRRPSSVTVALVDKPSDLTMGLPISCCVSGSAFYKLIKTERSSSSISLTELSWFCISSQGSSVFNGALVLSEIEVSAIRTGGLGSSVKESSDNNKLQTLLSSTLLIVDFCTYSLNLFCFFSESRQYRF